MRPRLGADGGRPGLLRTATTPAASIWLPVRRWSASSSISSATPSSWRSRRLAATLPSPSPAHPGGEQLQPGHAQRRHQHHLRRPAAGDLQHQRERRRRAGTSPAPSVTTAAAPPASACRRGPRSVHLPEYKARQRHHRQEHGGWRRQLCIPGDLGNFTLFTTTTGGQQNFANLKPGIYAVQETAQSGWDLTSAACSDGSDPPASIWRRARM